MLNILIVEDEADVAQTLRELVEFDDRGHVVAVAQELNGALAAADEHRVDVALIDIHLADLSTGYGVASELSGRGIRCIFVTGSEPPFPMPELALGCIAKPCTVEAVQSALDAAAASIAADDQRAAGQGGPGFTVY